MCDDCEKVFHGPFQGELAQEARHLSYDELSMGWKHGTVDASWFCVDCWSEKFNIGSIGRTRKALSLPLASRPAAVVDNRFHQRADRCSICDNCDCYVLHRTRQGLAPRQLRLLHGQHTRRATQVSERMFPQAARQRDTLEKRFLECEVPVQDMPSPTMAKEALGDHRVASLAQPRSIEGGIDYQAPVGKQRRQWMAELEWLPTRLLAGRQPEELEMIPGGSTTHTSREAHTTQAISSQNAENSPL